MITPAVKPIYQKPESAVKLTNSYNESVVYDKNGNIKSLKRTDAFDDAIATLYIDDLAYKYDPGKANHFDFNMDGVG